MRQSTIKDETKYVTTTTSSGRIKIFKLTVKEATTKEIKDKKCYNTNNIYKRRV